MDYPELLERQMSAWGLILGDTERKLLFDYATLLASYRQSNVIGTKDLNRILLDHVLDSLSCFLFEPLHRARQLADVGSGGGLPGIPILIAKPDLRTTLIDSTEKKCRFLNKAAEMLAPGRALVANARVEDLAHNSAHRGTYDVATTRAVAPLSVIAEYCVPLLKVGACAISMKAHLERAELAEGQRAANLLGARISEPIQVSHVKELTHKVRQLVIIEKMRETHPRYPRRPGTPNKRPLGAA
jgi:16S rRNA (guanine527-N7)-methyltransferase